MKKYHLFLLFCLFRAALFAQVDTEFWFAVPEAVSGHADRPISLYVTNAGQTSNNVQVSIPANPNFLPLSISLSPYSSHRFDLTPYINGLENGAANIVTDKGLYIKATALITAYYEIEGESSGIQYNPELFALKGKNALGTKFFIPMQTLYQNGGYSGNPRAGFDIVATENNTVVTITPTQDLIGSHAANVPFSITLQKGQTYSAQSASTIGNEKPAGSKVEANKPIAITYKDDSITPGGCADIIGDQLVSIENIGKEYIIINGPSNYEYAFITATENNTQLFINGNPNPTITLQAGESYTYNVLTPADYIRASQAVYVLQLTAIGCEFGGAILPSVFCTGSGKVSFTRSNPYNFYLNLVTKKGYEDGFLLNGTPIASNNFSPVIGTNNVWMAASIQRQDLPLNATSTIENTKGLFHVGLLAGDGGTGMSYGYFSDFSALNIGSDITLCEGQSIMLNAGSGKDSYSWSTGSTGATLTVNQAGTYWISVIDDNCQSSDTLTVSIKALPNPQLGNDTSICKTIDLTLDSRVNNTGNLNYLWQDGSTQDTFHATNAGLYYVKITEQPEGCVGTDSILISQGILLAQLKEKQDINCHFPLGTAEVELTQVNPHLCQYSLDSIVFQNSPIFTNLDSGNYTIYVKDTLGCEGKVPVF
ncbi:MAG: IgGFc-binding protein, partial [Bacteroidia bacterium]